MLSLTRIAFASACLSLASPASADPRDWDHASSYGRDALIVAAIGIPAADGDWRGARDAALSIAITSLLTAGLKAAIHEWRPDRSNDHSFPSGHTSASFAAAAALGRHYGWEAGVPAHVAAGFVGYARVEAGKHYPHDVFAGAALGEAVGWSLSGRR